MRSQSFIYSFLFIVSVFVFSACGADTKENSESSSSGPYAFFNATTPLDIVNDGNSSEISVQVLEYGLAKAGELVQMLPFPKEYGFVTNSIALTDLNGKATFIYNPPTGADYNDIRGQSITIQAIFVNPFQIPTGDPTKPDKPEILLTQDFVLNFR